MMEDYAATVNHGFAHHGIAAFAESPNPMCGPRKSEISPDIHPLIR